MNTRNTWRRWGERHAPCRDCQDRTMSCHGKNDDGSYRCDRYAEFLRQNDHDKRVRREQYEADDAIWDMRSKRPRR